MAGSGQEQPHQLDCEHTVPELTRREAEIAGLVSQGLANKAVAGQLGVAEGTVKIPPAQHLPKATHLKSSRAHSERDRKSLKIDAPSSTECYCLRPDKPALTSTARLVASALNLRIGGHPGLDSTSGIRIRRDG